MHKLNILLWLSFLFCSVTKAEVITDGSVGKVKSLSGQMNIPQNLGQIKGANLFHSFKTFNINTGESATFTGSDNLKNVISRVTGGEASVIDGKLKSEVGKADFYFINPAGITFGKDASVDVPAAFHVSTADYLRFADEAEFNTTNLNTSSLTIAAPESFGFLNNQMASIKINGSQLTLKPAQTLDIVAGKIAVTNSELKTEAGSIYLTAVGKNNTTVPINDIAETANGSIVVDKSTFEVSGNGSGKIILQGGDIAINDHSWLLAHNTGGKNASFQKGIKIFSQKLDIKNSKLWVEARFFGNAGNITIENNQLNLKRGIIVSDALSIGNAGDVEIKAQEIVVDGQGSTALISCETYGVGNGGTVKIQTDKLDVLNAGKISGSTFEIGNAGNMEITAKKIVVDGQGNNAWISCDTNNNELVYAGDAGTVKIQTGKLNILNTGTVSSSTFGTGNAANVEITAKEIVVDGQGNSAWISSGTNNKELTNAGNAGTVKIQTKQLSVLNFGVISSSTFGKGNAGNVEITAKEIVVDGRGNYAWIASHSGNQESISAGDAGTVKIQTDRLSVLNAGEVSTGTLGTGNSGNVEIAAKEIVIDGQDNGAWIDSNTQNQELANAGNAGTVKIQGEKLSVLNTGEVSSSTIGAGNAGNVEIAAKEIVVDGQDNAAWIDSSAQNQELANAGSAGTVKIQADKLSVLNTGTISSSTWGTGNAGNVEVIAKEIVVDGQGHSTWISSNTNNQELANTGSAGTVKIQADKLSVLNTGTISSNTSGTGNAGNVEVIAKEIVVDGQGNNAWIDSNSGNEKLPDAGNAGTVKIQADELSVLNTGTISSDTFGTGNAGNVEVIAKEIVVDGQNNVARISSSTNNKELAHAGNAGTVKIQTDKLNLDTGLISSAAAGTGDAGNINIHADDINLQNARISTEATSTANAGDITIDFSHNLTLLPLAGISTFANSGNGGDITINGGKLISLENSGFITSVAGKSSDGGNINVNADFLIMKTGLVQANAVGGSGGDINLNLQALIPSYDSLVLGGKKVVWQQFVARNNVIQAASETGVSGTINVTAPQIDISGAISGLDTSKFRLPKLASKPCTDTSVPVSRLARVSQGGLAFDEESEHQFIPPITETYQLKLNEQNPNASAVNAGINQKDDAHCIGL